MPRYDVAAFSDKVKLSFAETICNSQVSRPTPPQPYWRPERMPLWLFSTKFRGDIAAGRSHFFDQLLETRRGRGST